MIILLQSGGEDLPKAECISRSGAYRTCAIDPLARYRSHTSEDFLADTGQE